MPRKPRSAPGGIVYHVLNRANAGLKMFRGRAEYAQFEQALAEARERVPVRVLGWCLMPDHWHLVVWPRKDGDLSEFMRWLAVTHTRRWHSQRGASGTGHLYQGRYRSFPIEPGPALTTVLRYVESNPRRDGRVKKAEAWPWSSLGRRIGRQPDAPDAPDVGPDPLPRNWVARVNEPLSDEGLKALRNSVQRGAPFGSEPWKAKTIRQLKLEHTTRPRGRPRKHPKPEEPAAGGALKPKTRPVKATTRRAATPVPPRGGAKRRRS